MFVKRESGDEDESANMWEACFGGNGGWIEESELARSRI